MKGRLAAFVIRLIGLLPLNLARLAGRLAGVALWYSNSEARCTTEVNLQLSFPDHNDQWRRRTAFSSLVETSVTACEIASIWSMPVAQILRLIDVVEGQHYVDNALAAGKGVVLIAPHLGNWEITNYFVARHYPLVAMYAPPKLVALEKLIHAARERSGGQLVPANKRGVVAIFKHLRNAGVTGILPDQEPATKSGVFAPFYGHKVLTPVLVSKLIQETRAEAILVYALRLANGRFRLVFRPAHDAIYQSDIATSAAAMNRSIELAIREAPEQYQWEYKRFRKRPAGEPRRYPISTKQRKRIARSTSDS